MSASVSVPLPPPMPPDSQLTFLDFGETEAEERELEVWLHGYMDPYEGEIDTAKYSMAEIVSKLFSNKIEEETGPLDRYLPFP